MKVNETYSFIIIILLFIQLAASFINIVDPRKPSDHFVKANGVSNKGIVLWKGKKIISQVN